MISGCSSLRTNGHLGSSFCIKSTSKLSNFSESAILKASLENEIFNKLRRDFKLMLLSANQIDAS